MNLSKILFVGVLACFAGMGHVRGQTNLGTAAKMRLDQTTEQLETEGENLAKKYTNQMQGLKEEAERARKEGLASNPWFYAAIGLGIILAFRNLAPLLARRPSQPQGKPEEMIGVPGEISIEELQQGTEDKVSSRETQFVNRFFASVSDNLGCLRKSLSELGHVSAPDEQQKVLKQFLEQVRELKSKSNLSALRPLCQVAGASEALLDHLTDKHEVPQPSTVRTLASAIDLLHSLSARGVRPDLTTVPTPRLLVVDDDPVSRYAVGFAVKRFLVKPDSATHGEAALALAEETAYDLILLDVQMPRMDGFELFSRIHATAANRTTPIVFVTAHGDFDARARSSLLGGQELISKPFLTAELSLKALTLVLRRRLQREAGLAHRHTTPAAPAFAEALSKPTNPRPEVEPASASSASATV